MSIGRMRRSTAGKVLRNFERFLVFSGVVAIAIYASSQASARLSQAYDRWAFDQVLKGRQASIGGFIEDGWETLVSRIFLTGSSETKASNTLAGETLWDPGTPAQENWSPARIRAYRESLAQQAGAPLARLEIPSVGLSVMVREGTDSWTLNRGAGHIEGTSMPDGSGTVGIAAHRDGYFRDLQNISENDPIVLTTLQGTYYYRVGKTSIVDPSDMSVLNNTGGKSLVLVTCYPFYYVGSAPKRFVVTAYLDSAKGDLGFADTLQPYGNGTSCRSHVCFRDRRADRRYVSYRTSHAREIR